MIFFLGLLQTVLPDKTIVNTTVNTIMLVSRTIHLLGLVMDYAKNNIRDTHNLQPSDVYNTWLYEHGLDLPEFPYILRDYRKIRDPKHQFCFAHDPALPLKQINVTTNNKTTMVLTKSMNPEQVIRILAQYTQWRYHLFNSLYRIHSHTLNIDRLPEIMRTRRSAICTLCEISWCISDMIPELPHIAERNRVICKYALD